MALSLRTQIRFAVPNALTWKVTRSREAKVLARFSGCALLTEQAFHRLVCFVLFDCLHFCPFYTDFSLHYEVWDPC